MIKSNFKELSPADFLAQAERIVTAMTGNANFPEPWASGVPSLSQIEADLTRFKVEFTATSAGNKTRIVARNAARDTLARDLDLLAHYVQLRAGDDDSQLATTAFPFRKPYTRSRIFELPSAPEQFRPERGPVSGMIVINSRPVPNAACYDVQIATADPTAEGSWSVVGSFKNCRGIQVPGLTPGRIYWFRMRAIGKAGQGAWSTAASLMVV